VLPSDPEDLKRYVISLSETQVFQSRLRDGHRVSLVFSDPSYEDVCEIALQFMDLSVHELEALAEEVEGLGIYDRWFPVYDDLADSVQPEYGEMPLWMVER